MKKFSIQQRLKSFKHAFNGLRILITEEHNSWIHLFVSLCVVVAGFWFGISMGEWIAIVLCIGLVLSLELINTAIERIANFVSPQRNAQIKHIKDLAAAAVFVGAVASVVVGLIIFLPKII